LQCVQALFAALSAALRVSHRQGNGPSARGSLALTWSLDAANRRGLTVIDSERLRLAHLRTERPGTAGGGHASSLPLRRRRRRSCPRFRPRHRSRGRRFSRRRFRGEYRRQLRIRRRRRFRQRRGLRWRRRCAQNSRNLCRRRYWRQGRQRRVAVGCACSGRRRGWLL
jgi:hypothetical protein